MALTLQEQEKEIAVINEKLSVLRRDLDILMNIHRQGITPVAPIAISVAPAPILESPKPDKDAGKDT